MSPRTARRGSAPARRSLAALLQPLALVGPLRRLRPPALAITAITVYGVAGYMAIERYSVLDAVFMTVITITTVGYEEVRPLDDAGKLFSISLIVFGVVGFLYTFGVIVEELTSGRWVEWRRRRSVESRIGALRDHVILCGYGRTGVVIGRELERSGEEFVVVELSADGMENVRRDGRLCVVGDAADDEILERAGIHRARALISAVDSDERNVYIVLTARSVNPGLRIVARSSYPDSVPKLSRAGANRVVSPYTEAGQRMAALALQPAVVDVVEAVMGDGASLSIEELLVPEGAPSVAAAALRAFGAALLAVRHPGGALVVGPPDDLTIAPGDLVIALGSREQLSKVASAVTPQAVDG
ncbi:MAG TPA: potassium channel family protein [Candidatus Dormibacteraeota bacterium]|nr:potassium channel family protein [Candidatus Dormibacteraeota bacterium]